MIDKEKVVRGLECCKWSDAGRYDGYEPMYENCEKCPYNNEQDLKSECNNKLRQDVLSLLKEQEPVKWSYEYNCFVCSNCGLGIEDEVYYLMNKPLNFCPTCGRKIKWDE